MSYTQVFGGILFFVISVYGNSCPADTPFCSDPCGLTGNWTNELGSTMGLTCREDASVSGSGYMEGWYNTKPGDAKGFYPLSGRYTMIRYDVILGFSVSWNNEDHGNSKSATSWTGVYYKSEDKISTFWILTSFTPKADMWSNSNIGSNIFTRD